MNIKAVYQDGKYSKVDALVITTFEDGKGKVQQSTTLSSKEKKDLNLYLAGKKFQGKRQEALLVYGVSQSHPLIWVLGLGKKSSYKYECARRLASAIYKKAKMEKWEKLRIDLDSVINKNDAGYAQGLVEGFCLSDYTFDTYKQKPKEPRQSIKSIELSYQSKQKTKSFVSAVDQAQIISEGVNLARTFGNEPANELYPENYANKIAKLSKSNGVKCTIFDEKKLKSLNMGGILGVGRGSSRGPRLVMMEYKPKRIKNKKPIVLVGKGITFDTGGISIKPPRAMDEMKFDMCGSAAVVGAVQAIAKLKLPVYVIGFTPLAENMPGGRAQRPGDVIKCHNGKTVEVLNTDAEGRLVLADALAYSEKFSPKCVVDIATLTGACAHTLDYAGSGVMTNDPAVLKKLQKAGDAAGERLWEFPLWEEYDEFIKGTYADIQNLSRRTAGIQTAGAFLKHFGDHSPWAHIDIAGTAWGQPRFYNSVGATGVGVRLFVEFVKSHA